MSVKVKKQLVPKHLRKVNRGTNSCAYITIHETANRNRGAGAQAHANLQSRGNPGRNASWHYQVDDKGVIQSYPDTARVWHAGAGNTVSIAIEICVNPDSDYEQALANAAALARKLRKKHKIPASRVVQHFYWTGKNCPTILRSRRNGWTNFVAATNAAAEPVKKKAAPAKPKHKASSKAWPQVALKSTKKHTKASHAAWVQLLSDVGHLRKGEKLTVGVQRWLNSLGYDAGPTDGVFGPRTTRALQAFLVAKGHLPSKQYIDGKRGPVTIAAEIVYLNSQRKYY